MQNFRPWPLRSTQLRGSRAPTMLFSPWEISHQNTLQIPTLPTWKKWYLVAAVRFHSGFELLVGHLNKVEVFWESCKSLKKSPSYGLTLVIDVKIKRIIFPNLEAFNSIYNCFKNCHIYRCLLDWFPFKKLSLGNIQRNLM